MKKLSLKKIILGTSLLGLSFVATAGQYCDFCRKEHDYPGCPCVREREERNKSLSDISYKWNPAVWLNLDEFLRAEIVIQNLIGDLWRYCTYPVALAIQEVLFDNGQKYGYYWQKRNAPKAESDVQPYPLGDCFAQFKQGIIDNISKFVRTPQQALRIDLILSYACSPNLGNGLIYDWVPQYAPNVFAGTYEPFDDRYMSFWELYKKEGELPLSSAAYLARQKKRIEHTREWVKYQRSMYLDELDDFIRFIDYIDSQERANVVNTVLCLIASRYGLPWDNRNNFIENLDLENVKSPGIYEPLFESISSIEDLLKVDNAMKAESIRKGRFVWHAQGDAAAAQADQ